MFKFKRNKIYTDALLLPLRNWKLLNLKKDYGYLYKQYRKPRKDDNLAEIYENINLQIYDIIGIDLTLLISYKSYINEYNKLHSEIITNRKNNIELHLSGELGKRANPKTSKYNKAFSRYINALHNVYKDFTIIEYNFIPDIKSKMQAFYKIDIPDVIFDFIKHEPFYNLNNFYGKFRKCKDDNIKILLLSDNFKNNFIKSKKVKTEDLFKYHAVIQKDYQSNAKLNEFYFEKRFIFDFNKLEKTPKYKSDITDLIASIRLQGTQINEKEISTYDFYVLVKKLSEQAEKLKKESNKETNN